MPFTPYNSGTQTSTTDYSPLQDFLKANNPAYAQTNFQGASTTAPSQSPQPTQSPVSAIAGDALSTLVVKPGVRIAQAAAAPLVQEKMDSTTQIQQQQTDQLNKVIGLLKTETDPVKKAALHDMALNLVKESIPNTQAGQQANAADASLSGNTHILGQDVAGQQGGEKGFQQIAGDAAKSASYLAGGEGLGELGEGATALEKIQTGATSGLKVGVLGGAGQELEDPNATAESVAKQGAKGGVLGTAIGAGVPVAAEGLEAGQKSVSDLQNGIKHVPVNDLSSSVTNSLENSKVGEKPGAIERAKAEIQAGNKPPVKVRTLEDGSQVIEDGRHHLEAAKQLGLKDYPVQDVTEKYGTTKNALSSRIADATPNYDKKIATDYIKNTEGKTVPRVNEGEGFGGKRTVNTSASETANGTELNNIKNYPDNGSFLQKYQAVHEAIGTEAKSYKAGLAAEDKANPLLGDEAKNQVSKNVFDNLNGDARDAFLGKENKLLSQNGQPIETAKSIVGRYGQAVADATSNYDGTRLGLQTLKEDLEKAYQDARGNSAYGSEQRNGIDQMNSVLRDYLKKELSSSTENTDVIGSLDKQSKLYRANEVLQNKAEAEATSHYGRILQKNPGLRKVTNILSRQGIMIPLRIVEALAGVGLATSAARKLVSGK